MIQQWFNYQATAKILVFSLIAGAALPGLFALGVRFQTIGSGAATVGAKAETKNPAMLLAAWVIYAVVIAAIGAALLFIARDFIAHQTGYSIFGAKVK